MVDFAKLRLKTTRTIYRYRCNRCGKIEDYLVEMNGDMATHQGCRLFGRLVEVSRREEPKC